SKPRRRRKKHDGLPQLQFVTATALSQFKDEPAKRTIRSQAMISHRHSIAEAKKKGKGKGPLFSDAAVPEASISSMPSVAQERSPALFPANPVSRSADDAEQNLVPLAVTSWTSAASVLQLLGTSGVPHPSKPRQDLNVGATHMIGPRACLSKVVHYEESDSHEEAVLRMLVGKLARVYQIGDGVDPFEILPQFEHPELSALYLTRKCMRAFASDSTIKKWLPAMLSHRHIILSSTILASTWLDMQAGSSGDSRQTVMVKGETINMIAERLRDSKTVLDDATLMVILHLFAGEFWSCNEKSLRYHESAVARFIAQRGGMDSLENRAVVEVAAACCYHCDIFCESEQPPIFRAWKPAKVIYPEDVTALPESPLFCPRGDFGVITNDAHCSPYTLQILSDMRDLTDVFIAHNAGLGSVYDVDIVDECRPSPPAFDYDAVVTAFHQRVVALPSAHTPGYPSSNDWVYEACRIASLIYMTAIIMRVPFSVAATLNTHHYIPTDSESEHQIDEAYSTARLTRSLFEVLKRTDQANLWDNMSGVLYWVSAVGAAAARTAATMDMTQRARFRDEEYSVWVRRCLIMSSTRTMIVLIFRHPTPILIAQKRLLKVQELIGTGHAPQATSKAA
ncbi:hypothetical protein EK21DRAFT_78108, partial [Setomelanomma holmii]